MSSPQVFHWYANYKKKQAGGMSRQNDSMAQAPELEDLKERMLMLQKHYLVL